MKLKTSAILIAGALMGAAIMPAQANNDAMIDLLKVLRDKGTISNDDYKLLTNAAVADKEMADASKEELKKEVETATANMPVIETNGKLVVSDREGNWSFQPIGRVMWDAISVDNDGLYDGTAIGDNEGRGTELRRARLGFEGDIYDWSYKFEADFAGGDASIKDAYVGYGNGLTDTTKWGVKLGQSHIAFGYNTKASSKYMSFIDRPFYADSTISPARQSGAVVQINDKDYRWLLASSFTSGEIEEGETDVNDADTFAVRGSFVPFMQDEKHLFQIGAGYLNQGNGDDSFRYRQRAVSHITSERPIDTSVAGFDGAQAFTVDALGIYGPFHALAEYVDFTAESNSNSDQDFTGYSVEAGYFLTGESYKWSKGFNSGVSPKSAYGAWQLVARFENVETEGLVGGSVQTEDEADKYTIGLNYIPRKNIRLMLNYDKITDLTVNGVSSDAEPSALKFRAQAFW
ncbi:OprO/OprP family phosphate-selective porin [Methylophaga sp.]|uniref:OprO/OprP family phosphate-selective porin n=1 Tax=Methylophaga sp. TaxID=2024840 RepID=UPI003A941FD8